MNKRIVQIAGCLATLSAIGLARAAQGKRPLRIVPEVDLARYAGQLESGEQIQAEGVARVAGKGQPNSILKVRFAPAFLSFIPQVWGDYQIIALSPDYTYALVGDPAREYLWILSRSRQMDEATYNQLVDEARAQDFDVSRLQKTRQSGS